MNDRFHELTPEEQAQVSSGISIGAAGTTELRPGQGGHAATAENRFDALAGLTTLQIRQIPIGDSRFQIAGIPSDPRKRGRQFLREQRRLLRLNIHETRPSV